MAGPFGGAADTCNPPPCSWVFQTASLSASWSQPQHALLRRLCDPYITWPILVNMFGDELAGEVACKYLTEVSNQRYKLRPQYAT